MFERADDLFRCWINVARKNALFQLTTSALMGLLTGSLKELHLPSFFAKAPKNRPQSSQVEFVSRCNLEWGLAEKASGGCTCFITRICPLSSSRPRAAKESEEQAFASTVSLQSLGESFEEKYTVVEIF